MEFIKNTDIDIYRLILKESKRQQNNLELIASENATSPSVMEVVGSILTNKYAEGYPHKRYYGGCEIVDEIENLAIERAKSLFDAEAVNVQPHSGSQANMAVYMAELSVGDKVMGMGLMEGGHLTHGSPVNFSGKLYEFYSYGIDYQTGLLDYDQIANQAKKIQPKMIVAGASAYPRKIDFSKFRQIADSCGAILLVDIAHIAGLIASGEHVSPIPYADYVTSTTHKTLRGPRGGIILTSSDKIKKINSLIFPGIQGGPLMHVVAGKAVAFKEAMGEKFKQDMKKTIENCSVLADELKKRNFNLVSSGSENHLLLIDLTNRDLSGKDFEIALDKASITVNKNSVPGDKRSPFVTSGVRVGTPTVTTRGMGRSEMLVIAEWMEKIANDFENETLLRKIKREVNYLCQEFPLY